MTLHADCIEAERAHNQLTGLYLSACVHGDRGHSDECRGCSLRPLCEEALRPAPPRDGVLRHPATSH